MDISAKNEALVSIVVPVYNAEKYLEKCVQSVAAQTYTNWELILVNDGSADKSGELCDRLQSTDSRIKAIHKENGGVSSARNRGLDAAKGDYISFVDADDFIEPNHCSALLAGLSDERDLVVAEYVSHYKNRKKYPEAAINRRYTLAGLKADFDELYGKNLKNTPCAKLYHRGLIGSLRFDESVAMGEDLLFNLAYMERCENIVFISDIVYDYNRISESSATKKLKDGYFEETVETYLAAKAFRYEGEKVEAHDVIDKYLCRSTINLLQLLCSGERKDKKAVIKKWLADENLQFACRGSYAFPLKYKAVQLLCRLRSAGGILLLYGLKNLIARLLK